MQLSLRKIAIRDARVFKREPYVVGLVTTEDGEYRIATPKLDGVKRGEPGVFDPPVELVDFGKHPGWAAIRLVAMESDGDYRRSGEIIAGVTPLVNAVLGTVSVGGAPGSDLGIAAVRHAAALLVNRLKGAKDDLLGELELEIVEQPMGDFVRDAGRARLHFALEDE